MRYSMLKCARLCVIMVTIFVCCCQCHDAAELFDMFSLPPDFASTIDPDVGGPDPNSCTQETGYVEFKLPGCGCCGGCGCNVTCENCGDPGGIFYPGAEEYLFDDTESHDRVEGPESWTFHAIRRFEGADGPGEDRPGRPDGPDGPGRPGKPDRPGRPGGPDGPGRPGKPDIPGRPGGPDGPGRPGKPDRPGRPGGPDGPGRSGKPDRPGRPGKPGRPDRPDHGKCCEKWPGDEDLRPGRSSMMRPQSSEVCRPRRNCCTGKVRVTTWWVPPGCKTNFREGPSTKIIKVYDDFGLHRERAVIFNDGYTWQVVFKERMDHIPPIDPSGTPPAMF